MINVGEAIGYLDLDTSGVKRGITSALSDLKVFSDSTATSADKLKTVEGVMKNVGMGFTKYVTIPLVGAGAVVGKLAVDFESGMKKVATISDSSIRSIDSLSKGVLQISNDVGIGANELSEALYQTLSATNDTASSLEYLETAAKLAKGGFTDVSTAIDGATSVMNAYGMQGQEAFQRISDIMVTTQNLGKTTVGELAQSLYQVIPTAASLGISFEEVSAALATITAQGTPTSVATTQLRQLFIELSKEGSKAAETFKGLTSTIKGYTEEEIKAVQAATNGGVEAIAKSGELKKKLLQQSQKEMAKSLERSQKEELKILQKNNDESLKSLDRRTSEEMSIFEKSYKQRIKMINNEFLEKIKLVDEEKYLKLKGIDDEINAITTREENENKAREDAVNNEKLMSLQERANEAVTLSQKFNATRELEAFKLELSTKEKVEQNKQRVEQLKKDKDTIKDQYDQKINAIKEQQTAQLEIEQETYTLQGEALKQRVDSEKSALREQQQSEMEIFTETQQEKREGMQEYYTEELSLLSENIKTEQEAFKESQKQKVEFMSAVNEEASRSGQTFAEFIESGGTVEQALSMMNEEAGYLGVSLSDMFGSVEAGNAALQLTGIGGEKFNTAMDGMKNSAGATEKAFTTVTDSAKGSIDKLLENLKNLGIELGLQLLPLINGFVEGLLNLVKWFAGLDESQKNFIINIGLLIAVIGPILVMLSNFVIVVAALNAVISANPIVLTITLVVSAIGLLIFAVVNFANAIKNLWETNEGFRNAVIGIWDGILGFFRGVGEFFGKFFDDISNWLKSIPGWFEEQFNKAMDFLKSLPDNLKQIGSDIFNGLWNGFKKVWDDISNWFKGVTDSIGKFFGGAGKSASEAKAQTQKATRSVYTSQSPDEIDAQGSYAYGLDYVPYDGFIAKLHKGESIITAEETQKNKSGYYMPDVLNINTTLEVDGKTVAKSVTPIVSRDIVTKARGDTKNWRYGDIK